MPRKKRKRKSRPEETGLWISPNLSRLLHGGPRDEFDTSRVLKFADVALGVRPHSTPHSPPPPEPPASEPGPSSTIPHRPSEAKAPAPPTTPPRIPKLALRKPTIGKPRRLQVPKRPLLAARKPSSRPAPPKPPRLNYPKPPRKPKS